MAPNQILYDYGVFALWVYVRRAVGYRGGGGLDEVDVVLVQMNNKKLSYPQRKCASNVAILYGTDGISI